MKAIIALIAIAALAFAAVLSLRVLGRRTAEKAAATDGGAEQPARSAQDIMPVADIKGSTLIQRDGTAIAYVRVRCRNNSLLNTKELVRETERTAAALAAAASWPMKIIRLQRPVDSTRNIETLRTERNRCVSAISSLSPDDGASRQKREFALERIRAIDASIDALEAGQRNGGASRAECYIVLPVTLSTSNEEAAYNRAVDMKKALGNAGIEAEVLDGAGIVSLIMSYLGDYRTSAQNADPYAAMTLVRGMERSGKEAADAISAR